MQTHGSSCVAVMHWKNKHFCHNNIHFTVNALHWGKYLLLSHYFQCVPATCQLSALCTTEPASQLIWCNRISFWEFCIPDEYTLKGVFKNWHAKNIVFHCGHQGNNVFTNWHHFKLSVQLRQPTMGWNDPFIFTVHCLQKFGEIVRNNNLCMKLAGCLIAKCLSARQLIL